MFYVEMLIAWNSISEEQPAIPEAILSQSLWKNKFIKVGNKPLQYLAFKSKGILLVRHLFDDNGKVMNWETFRSRYNLSQKLYFKWMQLIDAIPRLWKQNVAETSHM